MLIDFSHWIYFNKKDVIFTFIKYLDKVIAVIFHFSTL
jgi:hypothetical protein